MAKKERTIVYTIKHMGYMTLKWIIMMSFESGLLSFEDGIFNQHWKETLDNLFHYKKYTMTKKSFIWWKCCLICGDLNFWIILANEVNNLVWNVQNSNVLNVR